MSDLEIKCAFKKNCFTCRHLDSDSCDCGGGYPCGHGPYLFCDKRDDQAESRSERMYKDGKLTDYVKSPKRCYEMPLNVSMNGVWFKLTTYDD